jgi:hypothetical protein
MSESQPVPSLDQPVRHFIYSHFVDKMAPPTVAETASAFSIALSEAEAVYKRLHRKHFLFLEPGSSDIRMANPLSAVPTNYVVCVDRKRYWANCAWDMLGIPAMLGRDAIINASYEDDVAGLELGVRHGCLADGNGVVHFPLPVRRWYDDLIVT